MVKMETSAAGKRRAGSVNQTVLEDWLKEIRLIVSQPTQMSHFLLLFQEGFCRFFGTHGSQPADQSSTISNAIMAAAGFGIAGLAFLLVVR